LKSSFVASALNATLPHDRNELNSLEDKLSLIAPIRAVTNPKDENTLMALTHDLFFAIRAQTPAMKTHMVPHHEPLLIRKRYTLAEEAVPNWTTLKQQQIKPNIRK
jgi:hypothetical protein